MALGIIAAIGVAASLASVGYTMSGAGQPQYPDLVTSSRDMNNLQASLLPIRRKLEAAAQQGGVVEIPNNTEVQQVFLPQYDAHGKEIGGDWVNVDDTEAIAAWQKNQPRNELGRVTTDFRSLPHRTQTIPGTRKVDFTGLGAADVQAKVADEMAKLQLDLSKKYDSQFIDEALAQQELADPEGKAARQKMSELIQQQIAAKPERPVADLLDKQISEQLRSANDKSLTPEMRDILDKSVADALASRGGQSAGGDFEAPLTTGFEGEQRQAAARQKALAWLSSGETPEDVEYRREQQNLANLSSEVNGRTPQSQFSSLSAAQNGPTPFQPGQPLPTMGPDQGFAANQMQTNAVQNAAMNQGVNQWIAGTSAAMQTAGSLKQAGVF